MKIKRIYAVFFRYLVLVRGNPSRFFQIFVWGSLDIILWGFITKYLSAIPGAAVGFGGTLLGAVILWSLLGRAQQGISTPALEDIWAHNLLNYFASPLRVSEYVFGLTLVAIVTSTLGLIVVLTLALVFFGFSIFSLGLMLAPFLLTLFLFGIAMGLAGVSLITRYGPSAEWFIWPLPVIIEPFVGVLYPTSILPHWMQLVALVLPPTYVFSGMRSVLLNGTFSVSLLSFGLILSIMYAFLGYLLYARVQKYAIKHGLITRYSAEGE